MGEDQDAAGARGLDEAERGHGLAGAGGVLEPEAAGGVGVVEHLFGGALLLLFLVAVPVERLVVVRQLLVALDLLLARRAAPRAGAGGRCRCAVAVALGLGEQRDQRARERVDLVGGERRAVRQVRLLLGEQALEPEQQRVLAPPGDRRDARGPRRSRPARRRARPARASPRPERLAGSSPSSRNGSRANFSARSRSAPETGAEARTEGLSAMSGFSDLRVLKAAPSVRDHRRVRAVIIRRIAARTMRSSRSAPSQQRGVLDVLKHR